MHSFWRMANTGGNAQWLSALISVAELMVAHPALCDTFIDSRNRPKHRSMHGMYEWP